MCGHYILNAFWNVGHAQLRSTDLNLNPNSVEKKVDAVVKSMLAHTFMYKSAYVTRFEITHLPLTFLLLEMNSPQPNCKKWVQSFKGENVKSKVHGIQEMTVMVA